MWRRSCAAIAEFPNRDPDPLGFADEIVLNAAAREEDDADRHGVEHLVIALERCSLGVPGPIGIEGDLLDVAVVGPTGGDTRGALRRTAVQQHHVWMLGVDLVEPISYCPVIVEFESAGLRTRGA